jgi:hypothetical protein
MTTKDNDLENKGAQENVAYSPSVSQGTVTNKWQDTVAELKHTFLTRDGWIGDYVSRTQVAYDATTDIA